MHKLAEPIDAVYLWVDGDSPGFAAGLERQRSRCGPDPSSIGRDRFRDNGELRYSLRSLESFAPWIRRIHVVTNGQAPDWLDGHHERIRMVRHEDIFTEPDSLPCFNSNAIELQLHRIPGLSRRFLYFNDDVFLGRECLPGHFVAGPDTQKFYYQETALPDDPETGLVHDRAYACTARLLTGDRRPGARRLPAHTPQLYDRTVIQQLERDWPEAFARTAGHRFRTPRDAVLRVMYSIHQFEGRSREPGHEAVVLQGGSADYVFIELNNGDTSTIRRLDSIWHLRPRFFCINDDLGDAGSEHVALCASRYLLHAMYPDPAPFERDAPSQDSVQQRAQWNERLRRNWGPEGVGSLELGRDLNNWSYRIRRHVFRGTVRRLDVNPAQARTLDVGSGTGFWVREWLALGADKVTAVDIADIAVARLRTEFPACEVLRADVRELAGALPGRHFDLISAFDLLFHIVDDDGYARALGHLGTLLAEHGRLILTENLLRGHPRQHANYWKSRSQETFESCLAEAGLELSEARPLFVTLGAPVDTKGQRPARLWNAIMKRAAARGLGNLVGASLFPVEKLLLRLAARGPGTKLVVCRRTTAALATGPG